MTSADTAAQEMSDRVKIQQLLALAQPLTEEITFSKDRAPTKVVKSNPVDSFGGVDLSAGRAVSVFSLSLTLRARLAWYGRSTCQTTTSRPSTFNWSP